MRVLALGVVLSLVTPSLARAQWYAVVYLGANHTRPADVTVQGEGYAFTFPKVEFDAESFKSPQYYGWRIGRMLGTSRRLGAEIEFNHLKVIANTDRLSPLVQRYQMTHGLNFIMANLVWRTPVGASATGDPPIAVIARVGGGPTLPHAETTVLNTSIDQYEYGGLGAHAALGLNVRLRRRWSMMMEYKVTYARPVISTARNGTGQTTALTHHLAVGFAFGLSR